MVAPLTFRLFAFDRPLKPQGVLENIEEGCKRCPKGAQEGPQHLPGTLRKPQQGSRRRPAANYVCMLAWRDRSG
eukprot:4738564-Pyramimonas_sp.AAC.1